MKPCQTQVKSKYTPQDAQKIKINADIKQGPPLQQGQKKEVFKFRSVNNIVIPPANTGNLNNNSTAVILTDQINKGPTHHITTTTPKRNNHPTPSITPTNQANNSPRK